jgi:hypothetical protein
MEALPDRFNPIEQGSKIAPLDRFLEHCPEKLHDFSGKNIQKNKQIKRFR